MSLLLFDELNNLQTLLVEYLQEAFSPESKATKDETIKHCEDMIFDMLLYSWSVGREDTISELGNILGYKVTTDVDIDEMKKSINKEIDGETYKDRIKKHIDNKDIEGIKRVVETEVMRNYNTAKDQIANSTDLKGTTIKKMWVTVGDEKVRDTHSYLDGVVVGKDDRFYTYDGDSARFPNDFDFAQNNVNCRCSIVYIK